MCSAQQQCWPRLRDDWFAWCSYHLCGWSFWRTCIAKSDLHLSNAKSTEGVRRYRTKCPGTCAQVSKPYTRNEHTDTDSSACRLSMELLQFGWIVGETGVFGVLWVLVKVLLPPLLLSGNIGFQWEACSAYSKHRCATVEWNTWIQEIGDTLSHTCVFIQRIELLVDFRPRWILLCLALL